MAQNIDDESEVERKIGINRAGVEDPYKFLALSVITKAIEDTRRGNSEAQEWLAVEAPDWLDGCGVEVDPDKWASWVAAGCRRKFNSTRRKRL